MGTHPIFESDFDCLTVEIWKMAEMRIRCRHKNGQKSVQGVTENTTIRELQEKIQDLFGIARVNQKIRMGYPPQLLVTSDQSAPMSKLKIKSGETLIVEGVSQLAESEPTNHKADQSQSVSHVEAGIRRHEVPADNHCLFYSIYFLMNEGKIDKQRARGLRRRISDHVLTNQSEFNRLVLDNKEPDEYAAWIQSDNSWGGSIELSIFSTLYRVEIDAVDIMTNRVDRYNQDKYSQKVFLLYDGIHYDPLFWDSGVSGLPKQYAFPSAETIAQNAALKLAQVLKAARQYTDTANYKIRCGNCGAAFEGDKQVAEHANRTGHFNFQEI